MKINLSKERCMHLANIEGDETIAAGALPRVASSASELPISYESVVNGRTPTPETDKAAFLATQIDGDGVPTDFARRLERERNAAIKMAWELVQELTQKCDDPIHKRQLVQIRELHHAWTIPQNVQGHPAGRGKNPPK